MNRIAVSPLLQKILALREDIEHCTYLIENGKPDQELFDEIAQKLAKATRKSKGITRISSSEGVRKQINENSQ